MYLCKVKKLEEVGGVAWLLGWRRQAVADEVQPLEALEDLLSV
jgi:hypothetical protein